ncbi:PAS domain S-box protein [Deltaproteobacteria bacterium]|nr:PAS domain S-box protein [Deltaproteobacteria bacterium]
MGKLTKDVNLSIDQVQRLTTQTFLGLSATLINSIVLSVVLWSVTHRSRIIIWLFLVLAVSLIRVLIQLSFQKIPLAPENIIRRKNFFLIALILSGCIWGSAGAFLFPYSSIAHQVLIAFVLGGMVAGSVGVFASVMAAFYAFSIPTLFPIIFVFFQINDDIHFAMGFMIFLFWFLMLFTAKRLNRDIINFFNLKYENLDLISDLEREIKDRKSAEEDLRIQNQQIEAIVRDRTMELIDVNKKLLQKIEDHKKASTALRESEEKFREIANSLPQIVFETDSQAILTFTNRNASELFGYTKRDFGNGLNLLQMLSPEDQDKALININRVLNGENLEGNEYMAQRKDGSAFPVSVHSTPVIRENRITGMRGIIIDLTEIKHAEEEQKRLEAQLQRAQKMEALGILAGGVAHDLNNVLTGIVSYPEFLLMEVPENSPLREPILTILNSGKKAAAIVQDLLTLTRRGVISEEVVNLNDVISEYLKSPEYKRLMSFHHGVRLKVELEPNLLNILGSPVHLTKTVMNLVSNAAEALPNDGKIFISTNNSYLDRPIKGYGHVDEGDYAMLNVSDNGIGISPDDLERIFEPFFTKKVMGRSGTGLGMAVVWGTVKDHKGYIDVKSSENNGSIFTLYFPATRRKITTEKSSHSLDEFRGRDESILLVDDIKEQREIASAILIKMGYSVTTVSSGEEAIEYLKKNSIDLLVLDMIMDPGMDGLDTYRNILEIHPYQKAIIASGFSETERVKEAQRLGAGAYIRKPYTIKNIGSAVRAELDRGIRLQN